MHTRGAETAVQQPNPQSFRVYESDKLMQLKKTMFDNSQIRPSLTGVVTMPTLEALPNGPQMPIVRKNVTEHMFLALRLIYRLLRPFARPLAHRLRTFLLTEVRWELAQVKHQLQESSNMLYQLRADGKNGFAAKQIDPLPRRVSTSSKRTLRKKR